MRKKTITTIIHRGYVSRENKRLYPTEMGITVNRLMMTYFPEIVDIEFTAEMEEKLDLVEGGTMNWKEVLGTIAGDNTIFLAVRNENDTAEIADRIRKLAGKE